MKAAVLVGQQARYLELFVLPAQFRVASYIHTINYKSSVKSYVKTIYIYL
jgi:hypothetical protein